MCTNSAGLVNILECYMDVVVNGFEGFVEKSMVIISVAVGAFVLMLGYVLKAITDRQTPGFRIPYLPRATSRTGNTSVNYSENALETAPKNSLSTSSSKENLQKVRSTQRKSSNDVTNSYHDGCKIMAPVSRVPSCDEKFVRNVGLSSCSKSCMQNQRSLNSNSSKPKTTIPSDPTCAPNNHLATPRQCSRDITNQSSCCSLCCADDCNR